MKTQNWGGTTGGGTFGQKTLLFLFHWNHVTIGYAILALVVPFYMLFGRKGYNSIYHYFRRQWHFSRIKSLCKTYQNHFVFGVCMLDRFAVYAGKRNFFSVNIIGNEHFQKLINGDKGFIMVSSHVGNFELSGYLLKQDKKQINALIYAGETQTVQQNRSNILKNNNINLIPVLDNMSHLFAINSALQNGEIVSMPCDRNLGSAKSIECDFLNGKADFPMGAFALATTFEVEVLAIFVIKNSIEKYTVYVKPVTITALPTTTKRERIALFTHSYAKELELIVKNNPVQWFNFFEFWK
jgi:predicted LPLAT superfamily acyltransferase